MPKLSMADRIRTQTLYKTGKTILQLSRNFKVDPKIIRKCVNRPRNQVSDKNRSGRPPKVTPRISRRIKRELQQPNASLRKLGQQHSLHHTTILRIATNTNQTLYPYKVKTQPLLTTTQKDARIDFVEKYKDAAVTRDIC